MNFLSGQDDFFRTGNQPISVRHLSQPYNNTHYTTIHINEAISLVLVRVLCIGYHISGEVISVLSLEGRYYNCHERAQRARDNYHIVTRVIQLISPSQSCDNLFITYLCLYQALNMENTETRSGCVLH